MVTQREKTERFRALHEREGAFIIPNPWDAGSARLLAGLGFEALARAALTALLRASTEMLTPGKFRVGFRCGSERRREEVVGRTGVRPLSEAGWKRLRVCQRGGGLR